MIELIENIQMTAAIIGLSAVITGWTSTNKTEQTRKILNRACDLSCVFIVLTALILVWIK